MRKLFYMLWSISLLYAIFVLLGGKIFSFGRIFIYEEDTGGVYPGELYKMCKIEQFRQNEHDMEITRPIDAMTSIDGYEFNLYYNNAELDNRIFNSDSADVLLFGDSFFASLQAFMLGREGDAVTDKLIAYNICADGITKGGENPLTYFERINYEKGRRRIVVVEAVERSSIDRALDYPDEGSPIRWGFAEKVIGHIFANDHVEYFFTDNILSYNLFRIIDNIKFKYFGDIDRRIGAYSIEPKMIFYFQGIEFDKMQKSASTLELVAENIKDLSDKLKRRYNIELLYTILPNKYSIYGDYADSLFCYDNFIPIISDKLATSGVNVIDVYSLYKDYRENDDSMLLYEPSGTHYSAFGREIFIRALVKKIVAISD